MDLRIVLGNQLFPLSHYKNSQHIFMCEDAELCTHFKYHKHKIIFFLASMRNYRDELKSAKKKIHYFEINDKPHFFEQLKKCYKFLLPRCLNHY